MDAEVFAEKLEVSFLIVFRERPGHSGMRLAEFLTAHIQNANTQSACLQAGCQFLEWADAMKLALKI